MHMRNRMLWVTTAITLAMVGALSITVLVAQTPAAGKKALPKTTTDTDAAIKAAADAFKKETELKTYTVPKTSWGEPDLRGVWNTATYTRLQRPVELGNKAFYTEEEAIAEYKKAAESDAEVDPRTVHYDWKEYGMDAWQSPIRPTLRTSLIVDPPTGRIPAMTPEGRKRQEAAGRGIYVNNRGLYERCVTGNQGPPRLPGNHDAESQIQQTPGYVILIMQSNSDVRIIPTDGRPHLPSTVRKWLGDSVGHWEGNTLVVDTTNFHPDREWRGSTSGMHLIERLTITDPKTLKYEFTVEDATTWTRPWSAEVVWPRIEPGIYEFACHEQNYGLMNVVKGAQIRAREASGRPAPETPEGNR